MMPMGPGMWRPSFVIPFGIVTGVFVAAAIIWPGQTIVKLVTPVLVLLVGWVGSRRIRLEVTETVVRARQGGWRGQPDKQVPRNDIRSIHYFPMMISFRGPDNTPIMKIPPHWTLRQMLKVAGELKVPLYDHTRWYGMREARKGIGQLVYDPKTRLAHGPASGPVVRNH